MWLYVFWGLGGVEVESDSLVGSNDQRAEEWWKRIILTLHQKYFHQRHNNRFKNLSRGHLNGNWGSR